MSLPHAQSSSYTGQINNGNNNK